MKTTRLIKNDPRGVDVVQVVQTELDGVPRAAGLTRESRESRPYIGTIKESGFLGSDRPVKKR